MERTKSYLFENGTVHGGWSERKEDEERKTEGLLEELGTL